MNQHTDTFAQRTRRLTSEVQRLRDWAGGDPQRLGRVADALVELTGHRLAGHAWAEAAPSAQEAVMLSAKVLAQHGPVGPYTPRGDAVRSVTALVHLAVIQSAAGLAEGAEQSLAAAFALRGQLSRLELDAALDPATIGWALLTWARVALAGGDLAAANARADAAVAVGVVGQLGVDIDRAAAEARWAAGWPEPSVEHDLRAVERYDAEALPVLQHPAGAPAALLERLSEPLFGLYSETADRVLLIGAHAVGLTLRRRLVDLLGALAVRRPALQPLLVTALGDLADDLRSCGRRAEADDAAELAASIAGEGDEARPDSRVRTPLGAQTSWAALPPAEVFGVRVGAQGEASGRLAAWRGPADAAEQRLRAEAEARLLDRAEVQAAERERAEREAAERVERQRRQAADEAQARRLAEQQAAQAAEIERLEKQRRRAERIAEHERQAEREAAEREAALRARVSEETAAERAEREELERLAAELAALETAQAAELERELAQAEAVRDAERATEQIEVYEQEALAEAEAVVEQVATEPMVEPVEPDSMVGPVEPDSMVGPVEPDSMVGPVAPDSMVEPVEPDSMVGPVAPDSMVEPVETVDEPTPDTSQRERIPDQERAARRDEDAAERERLAAQRVDAERPAAELAAAELAEREQLATEQDALEQARQSVEQASGRRETRDATEALVDELRGRYEADPATYLNDYLDALDHLATARWQAGDWWGSREPSKAAKALRRQHGL
ncbi:hypothetical protein [Micropruina sp.]|uniref:hypothetical protein n=1 Tax=Micropruina sp. TaxID=2737536 RepID=UPI0039E6A774